MSAIESEIIEEFYVVLANNEHVTPKMIERLRVCLAPGRKLKSEELVIRR
jgi:hypothetical protein